MAAIPYVGATQASARDLVTRGYVAGLLAANLTQTTVDNLINTGLGPYVTKSYVDAQDALNATKAFIDAGDATRLKLSQRNQPNGAAGLDATGRVDISRIAVASTQRWPKPFYSPAAYNAAPVDVTTEAQIWPTISVADPGFAYKLLVTGVVDNASSVDGEYPIVRVRQGSMTGPVVAGGYGLGEKYVGGLITQYATVGTFTYSIPVWAGALDVVAIGGGGGGGDGGFVFFVVPFAGTPGNHGTWNTTTLTRNTTLPGSTATLGVTVGDGGTRFVNGNPSTVTGAGVTTITADGGAQSGGNPDAGTTVYNGQSYVGGAGAGLGAPGNPPGGGGGGGFSGNGFGATGASGAVWIFAYPTPNAPSGPVNLIPTALNAQTPLTGATTLFVTSQRSGTASTQTISTNNPGLMVIPIPA